MLERDDKAKTRMGSGCSICHVLTVGDAAGECDYVRAARCVTTSDDSHLLIVCATTVPTPLPMTTVPIPLPTTADDRADSTAGGGCGRDSVRGLRIFL